MRLRNIPRADDTLQAHFTVIKNPKEFRGNWTSVFVSLQLRKPDGP